MLLKRSFATVNLPEVLTHNFDAALIPKTATVTKEQALSYLRDMSIIRRIEITSDAYYKNKEIRGFCHLSDGQEAISVGTEAGITFEDPLISAYRIHGQAYMRGISIKEVFAEMFGRGTGSSKGKGGSMHFYSGKNNFYGGNGIVGAQIPVGAGLGFALKYQNKKNASFVLFGDGAANQGQLYESTNMAGLWKLPVVFVCENNLYGMGTSTKRASCNPEIYTRGDYLPGLRVNGHHVLMIREIMKFAKEWVIENGPMFMEVLTYRYRGHSMSDAGYGYREREEVQSVRDEKDPILLLKRIIEENSLASAEEVKSIEKDAKKLVDAAAKEAIDDAPTAAAELFTDIYDPGTKVYGRNVEFQDSINKY